MSESSLETIMDFERVLDNLDLYVFRHWFKGELVDGPIRKRHWVSATFMWPYKMMPDPDGAARLLNYDIKVFYQKHVLSIPRSVDSYDDFRPGTKKPKLDRHKIWLVTIKMPIELISDFQQKYYEIEDQEIDSRDVDDAYHDDLTDTQTTDAGDAGDEMYDPERM